MKPAMNEGAERADGSPAARQMAAKNAERADAARFALAAHEESKGQGLEDLETQVLDLVTDCLHLLAGSEDGLSDHGMERIFRQARMNFRAEKGGES